ncbi:hypothetical protein [Arenimonas composti]|uniref:Uncharacterized protein n=1 Tax=Arenimonas composti TR7-09 = DSM 18010 TaxID=1121013 RepID=A0A091BDH1_9GAMM|nr:hypothetical protein [Arenimonas composti]KFN49796.1 hypothetical protein P873_09580 [Arenimonas composti TR7-09 = DSM 18010]
MGKHTAYWQAYTKAQVRGSLRIFAAIGAAIVLVIVLSLLHEILGAAFPWLLGAAFLGLAVVLVRMGRDAYAVRCPECGTGYRRHKWGGQCPTCGLRLLQDDP